MDDAFKVNGHPFPVGSAVEIMWDHPELDHWLEQVDLGGDSELNERDYPGPYTIIEVRFQEGATAYVDYRARFYGGRGGPVPSVRVLPAKGPAYWFPLQIVEGRRKVTLLLGPVSNFAAAVEVGRDR